MTRKSHSFSIVGVTLTMAFVLAGHATTVTAQGGNVFSFGFNANGRTGLGTDEGNTLVATPIDTSNLGGRTITQGRLPQPVVSG
jgi:hypothetical protein